MTKPCSQAERQIQLLIDGRIAPAERDALDRHLAACPACAARAEQYRALNARIASWATPKPSDDPGDRFNAAVLQRLAVTPPARDLQARWAFLQPVVAAALVVCFGGFLLWHLTTSGAVAAHLSNFAPRLPLDAPLDKLLALPPLASAVRAFSLPLLGPSQLTPALLIGLGTAALVANAWFIRRAAGARAEAQ